MRKIILSILSFLTISFFIFSNNSFAVERTITFKVDGMYCSACPAIIKKVLTNVDGVKDAIVSYSKKTAVVTFDDYKTDTTNLIQAVTKAGYYAKIESKPMTMPTVEQKPSTHQISIPETPQKVKDATLSKEEVLQILKNSSNKKPAYLWRKNLNNLDFSNVDFKGANLSASWMNNTNLSGADLTGVNLDIAFMYKANLKGAKLDKASMFSTQMLGADLSMASLEEATVAADLYRANLRGANFKNAKMGADMKNQSMGIMALKAKKAIFDNADLSGADLSRTDLEYASFKNANLSNANLEFAKLTGTDFTGANLTNTNFSNAELGANNFSNAIGLDKTVGLKR